LYLVSCILYLFLSGCGFHLRGTDGTALPESLTRLRLILPDSKLAYDPLRMTMKGALQNDPRVTVVEDLTVPTLVLYRERTDTHVLSVNASGQASGYVLNYELSFRLVGADGRELGEPRTIRIVRDYTFDPLNVLAKEREGEELGRAMQREAAQRIVWHLSKISMQPVQSKPVMKR